MTLAKDVLYTVKVKEAIMGFITGMVIGLLVGWNFFPQPKFVADWVANIKAKLNK